MSSIQIQKSDICIFFVIFHNLVFLWISFTEESSDIKTGGESYCFI